MDSTGRDIIKSRLESEPLNHQVDDSSVDTGSIPNLIYRGTESTYYGSEDSDDNNISTNTTDLEGDTYYMFDEPFEYCLNCNVLTVQGYNMERYVIGHLDVR